MSEMIGIMIEMKEPFKDIKLDYNSFPMSAVAIDCKIYWDLMKISNFLFPTLSWPLEVVEDIIMSSIPEDRVVVGQIKGEDIRTLFVSTDDVLNMLESLGSDFAKHVPVLLTQFADWLVVTDEEEEERIWGTPSDFTKMDLRANPEWRYWDNEDD